MENLNNRESTIIINKKVNRTVNFAWDSLRWNFPYLRIGVPEARDIDILGVTVINEENSERVRVLVTCYYVTSKYIKTRA